MKRVPVVVKKSQSEKPALAFGKRIGDKGMQQPKPQMLALPPPPVDSKPKIFDPSRLEDLSKPRPKADDPSVKPQIATKKKRVSRK